MPNKRLDDLIKKREQLNAQIQDARARERQTRRKEDTRRKIIAGALALEHMQGNPDSDFTIIMAKLLNRYVKRPADRELFALPPLDGDQDNTAPDATSGFKKANS